MIDQETQRGLVRSIASKVEGLTEGPLLDPMIQKLSFLRSAGRGCEAAMLSGVVAGGYATQQALYVGRRVLCPLCKWCGALAGTPQHRFFGCDGSKVVRENFVLGEFGPAAELQARVTLGITGANFLRLNGPGQPPGSMRRSSGWSTPLWYPRHVQALFRYVCLGPRQ